MEIYATKQELYESCAKGEAGVTVIAVEVYNADGELLGYRKHFVD